MNGSLQHVSEKMVMSYYFQKNVYFADFLRRQWNSNARNRKTYLLIFFIR
jgi:hypothetical protein